MRTLKLIIDVELMVPDKVTDEAVYEAICNQFSGTEGQGLQQWPGKGESVASNHEIEIFKKGTVWGSSL